MPAMISEPKEPMRVGQSGEATTSEPSAAISLTPPQAPQTTIEPIVGMRASGSAPAAVILRCVVRQVGQVQ